MKKLLWITLLFAACNSNESKDATTDVKDSSSKVEKKTNTASSGDCGKMIFFQQGAEMDAKTYNGSGKEIANQHTKVVDVKNEDGATVAYVEGVDVQADGKTTNVKFNYKCDGSKIYFDMGSLLASNAKESGGSFEGSMIEYPINVSAGQTLPDATGNMSFEKNGKKMTVTYHFKDRKVGEREEVTTSAGTFSCYKISHTVATEMELPNMNEKMKQAMRAMQNKMKMTSTTWFAPDFGIVKMEVAMNGKPITRTEITGVKK